MADKLVKTILGFFGSVLSSTLAKQIFIFILSMSPILELRGGLIAASLLDMDPVTSYIICIIGNIIPIPFILWFISKILDFMRKNKHLKGIAYWLDKRVEKHKSGIEKYGYLGVALFVGIPLPGTGAWTGCLVASVLGLDKKKSFVSALIGVLLASIIMMVVSFGILGNLV